MQKLICFLLVSVSTGIFSHADAQRNFGHNSSNREARNTNISPQRNERAGGADLGNPVNRAAIFRHNDGRANAINNSRIISANQQRNQVAVLENRNRPNGFGATESAYRQNRVINARNASVYNHYNNNSYRNYSYRNYSYRNSVPYYSRDRYYPHFFSYGPRYTVLPRSFITIRFGGYPYYYNAGLFYGLYGGYYQPLFPPPGITISVLPFGYSRIFIGPDLFYYYNGIYYRQYPDQSAYEVVDAPMGATVSSLPRGAKSVVLNGEKLYELNGTYYKEDRNYKGQPVYTVVGKHGEVNNTDGASENSGIPPSLNNGDVISQLPEGSKTVTINGEKLYVTPDNIYLKEEARDNMVQYRVVGE